MKYLKKFENYASYEEARQNLILPNVSYCAQENEVYYNPYVEPPFFCKLVLNNGETVKLEGNGELTSAMTSNYSSTVVSVEIGTLCTSIGARAFRYCSGLSSVTISNSVKSISAGVFYECTSLTSIDIPDSVTSIGDSAFSRCSGLTSVIIPNSVTSIGGSAFGSCSSLTSIDIPNSVTTIGSGAFQNCSGLTSVTVNTTTPPKLSGMAFSNTNNCPIYVPSTSVDTYKSASGWSTYESRIQAIQ